MPSLATAQPYAYVLGARDLDPAPPNEGIQVLTVIDTATNKKVATVPLGRGCFCQFPNALTISADGSRVYVANYHDNTVSVVDT